MGKCEFSGISSFGSLLRFSTDFEETALELYQKKVSGAAAEKFSVFAEKHRKRLDELELARREKLREEILEPITDFDSSKYCPNLGISDPVKQAIELVGESGPILLRCFQAMEDNPRRDREDMRAIREAEPRIPRKAKGLKRRKPGEGRENVLRNLIFPFDFDRGYEEIIILPSEIRS